MARTSLQSMAAAAAPEKKQPEKQEKQERRTMEERRGAVSPTYREGKVSMTMWQLPEVRKQLAQIALDQDTTQQALFGMALNLLFTHYRKPTIASEEKNR